MAQIPPCLRCPICGWRVTVLGERGHECVCKWPSRQKRANEVYAGPARGVETTRFGTENLETTMMSAVELQILVVQTFTKNEATRVHITQRYG